MFAILAVALVGLYVAERWAGRADDARGEELRKKFWGEVDNLANVT